MELYNLDFESFGCRVAFGWNRVAGVGTDAAGFKAKKVMIVTDAGVFSLGIPEQVAERLGKQGIQSVIFKDVSANPTDTNVREGIAVYTREGCDLIIAIGGGSAMDAAKGVRVLSCHEEPLRQYFGIKGIEKLVNPMPPLIAIPTTSGTGSEVSRGAMITDTERKVKELLRAGPASLALVDPQLTMDMPPQLTASTGMDALSHNLETFLSPKYHPVAEAIGYEGIRLVAQNLVQAVENGKNKEARIHMAMASTMGALAFQKGTGTTHATAHQLGSEFHIPHGIAIAIMMPHVMEFNREGVAEKLTRVAFAMGEKSPSPDAAIQAVARLSEKLGLPRTLSEVNAVESSIPTMARQAMEDPTRFTNPRPCIEEDMIRLYKKAM